MQAPARHRRAGPSRSSTPPAALAAAHFAYSGTCQRAGGPARRVLLRQRDGADVAAVIGFGSMGAAAIAEEAGRLAVGAMAEVLDTADLGALKPRRDVAGKIEHGVPVARGRGEEPIAARVVGGKARDEIGPDLVVRLGGPR